jgi:hypothetical protein
MPNQPNNNATSYCQRGRFLWGRVNSVGDPYFGQLTLPPIDLEKPGKYEIVYWVAFSCEGDGCSLSGDRIKMIVNDERENGVVDETGLYNIGFIKRWIRKSIRLELTDLIINVTQY